MTEQLLKDIGKLRDRLLNEEKEGGWWLSAADAVTLIFLLERIAYQMKRRK